MDISFITNPILIHHENYTETSEITKIHLVTISINIRDDRAEISFTYIITYTYTYTYTLKSY